MAAISQPLGVALGLMVGVALLVGGWRLWRGGPTPHRLLGVDLSPVARSLGDLTRRELPGGRFTLGALTGAMPCGAVYLALLQTSLLGSAAQGAAFMAAFGVGTLPALLGLSLLGKATASRLPTRQLVRLGAAGLMLAGCLSLARATAPLMPHSPDHAPCLLCSP